MSVVDHALLGLSVAALVGAGFRLAALCTERGLERALAASAFAAAFAVLEAMLLATVELGSNPLSLSAAALVTWLGVWRLAPAPALPVSKELKSWLSRASRPALMAVAAISALAVTWIAWSVNSPILGGDAIYYHLPQIIRWIHSGSPGAVDYLHYWLWVGDYPLTNGVLQAWGMGISRSMIVIAVWPVVSMAIFGTAAWVGLGTAGVGIRLRVLAVAALVTVPVFAIGLIGPNTDLPAVAWLACGAALFAGARANPRLAVPAVVALGLAAGTKPTALPLTLATLAIGLLVVRPGLRTIGRPLTLALALALAVGGFWYLRNIVSHGSPVWPWWAAPWGDPKPQFLERYASLLEYPRQTLEGRLDEYASFVAGAAILLTAGFLASFTSRARATRAAGVGVLAMTLLWASAPSTAKTTRPLFDGSVSQTRYLLPTIALAGLAIALVGKEGKRREVLACGVFGLAIAWNLGQLVTGSFPAAPSNAELLLGLVVGIALGLGLSGPLRGRVPIPGREPAVALTVGISALLAIPAAGWLSRHADTDNTDAGLARFLSTQAEFRDGTHPVYQAPAIAGPLTGDRLQHDVVLIRPSASCRSVARLLESGWVIIRDGGFLRQTFGYTVDDCLRGRRPLAEIDAWRVYAPRAQHTGGPRAPAERSR